MNELIKVSNQVIGQTSGQSVNARDLHAFLEVDTAFKDWITRGIGEYGFVEGTDFSSFLSESRGGRPAKEYLITLSMAKELAMVQRSDKGKQARMYFLECERIALLRLQNQVKQAQALSFSLSEPTRKNVVEAIKIITRLDDEMAFAEATAEEMGDEGIMKDVATIVRATKKVNKLLNALHTRLGG